MAKKKETVKKEDTKREDMETMSKSELVDLVAEQSEMKKKDVKEALDAIIDAIGNSLEQGKRVQLTGFGTFEVRERGARTGVKPGTTEKIEIPAAKYPAFKAGKKLKDSIKNS